MRKLMSFAALVLCCVCVVMTHQVTEASVIPMSVEDLTKGADVVVRGMVVDKKSHWTADGHMIETIVTISRLETLKGGGPAEVQIVVPGGDLDGISIRNGEAPTFATGEEVVVFGKGDGNAPYETFGCFQGKFTILDGMVRELNAVHYDAFQSQIQTALGR